jgi:hypothetical protein
MAIDYKLVLVTFFLDQTKFNDVQVLILVRVLIIADNWTIMFY